MSFITWNKANFKWEEKQIIWELASFIGGGEDFIEEIYKYDAEKKKRLIILTLKIYGDTITESKQKEIKQYKSDHAQAWAKVLGGTDFDIISEDQEVQDISHFEKEPE